MVGRVADLLLDHPRTTLLAWLVVVVALLPQAALVNGRLSEPSYIVSGTGSARALTLDQRAFGPNVELPILVSGPAAALSTEGPGIVAGLRRSAGGTEILSPFDARLRALRPHPDEAMLVAQIHATSADVLTQAGKLARAVRRLVHPPLRASITGEAFIGKSLEDQTLAGTHRAEAIAIPILLIVLLLVFGSPVAAAIPATFGIATVAAGFGIISLLALVLPLEATALSLASMMGLAIGVDYSLLLVARFREELGADTGRQAARLAARRALVTAGRTTAFAGGTLSVALVVALAVSPGTLILSSIIGVIVVACLSVMSANLAVPAALVLVGDRINRYTIWRPGRGRRPEQPRGAARGEGGLTGLVTRAVLRHPVPTALVILIPLVALGLNASALKPRTPGVYLLPPGDPARTQYAAISAAMGPGWGATFDVDVDVIHGTLTDAHHLDELATLERRIADQNGVAAVIGPSVFLQASHELRALPHQLASFERSAGRARPQLTTLRRTLTSAGTLLNQLTRGLTQAADASTRISHGAGQAQSASAQLAGGLHQLQAASTQLASGLGAAQGGAEQLTRDSGTAADGARQLLAGIDRAASSLGQAAPLVKGLAAELKSGSSSLQSLQAPATTAQTELAAAYQALAAMTTGRQDPHYQAALLAVEEADAAISGRNPVTGGHVAKGYPGLPKALAEVAVAARKAATGAAALQTSASQLQSGVSRLQAGSRALASGLAELQQGDSREAAALSEMAQQTDASQPGLSTLLDGQQQLNAGIASLASAAGSLSRSLRAAPAQAGPLRSGIRQARAALSGAGALIDQSVGLRELTRQSPGLFSSGDLLLAALGGAPPQTRREAASILSIDAGGQGARMFVIPTTGPTDGATSRLYDRLTRIVAAFARTTGTTAAVGGDAALVIDYARKVSGILPILIATLAIVTWLSLVVVVRAVLLPLIAVALNLLTVAAAFGALVLLYQGSAPLGGPGYLDAVAVVGIFGIVFGLSIDYEVFLVSRMREEYARTGSTELAIERGLLSTAGVVTGAAAIMVGVFAAFALSSFVDIAEFGTGLTVAVALDATLVRIVLLPALTRLCGDRAWWLPAWLGRILPSERDHDPDNDPDAEPQSTAMATA